MADVRIVDTTFRDGQQCLWATRLPGELILPAAGALDRAGFEAVEFMGAVHFDACVRYLGENPWERARAMKRRMRATPLQTALRSGCALSFEIQPADINRLWVELLAANGFTRTIAFDGLHDFDNLSQTLLHAKRCGMRTIAWLVFSESPVHTDALYAAKAREIIERADVDELMIQDTSGILTPERAATLIPAIKAVAGGRALGLHSHSLVGLPQRTYLTAVEHGVEVLYACIAPLADGAAPPSVQRLLRNLRYLGHSVDVDDGAIEEVSRHVRRAAAVLGRRGGAPQDYDAAHFDHQIPGGVLSNLVAQLEQIGLRDRLIDILHECSRVRAELGWPIQVTPFAQFIAVQATLNLVTGERYSVVPDEVKKYALGYFGKLLAPIEPNVLDRIVSRGSAAIAGHPPALEPALPQLRRKYPAASDEERLLRHAFPAAAVDRVLGAGAGAGAGMSCATLPLLQLIEGLMARRVTSASVRWRDLSVELAHRPVAKPGAGE